MVYVAVTASKKRQEIRKSIRSTNTIVVFSKGGHPGFTLGSDFAQNELSAKKSYVDTDLCHLSDDSKSDSNGSSLDDVDSVHSLPSRHVTVFYPVPSPPTPVVREVSMSNMRKAKPAPQIPQCSDKEEEANKFMLVGKGVPPFVEWSLSANEKFTEEMEVWPCNDYNKRGLSADFTLRPNLNRKINALRYADKHGSAVYYNSLAGKQKTHRRQVNLILPREDVQFQLERADWFQFFRGEMQMKLEKQYLYDNDQREKGLERFRSDITVPEARISV